MLAFMFVKCYVCVVGSVGCGLKAEHGNIMDVLEEKNNFFFFFVLSNMSLSLLPKQLIATYLNSSVLYVMEKWLDYVSFFFFIKLI